MVGEVAIAPQKLVGRQAGRWGDLCQREEYGFEVQSLVGGEIS